MSAAKFDFELQLAESYDLAFTYKEGGSAIDLSTGYTARLQVKEKWGVSEAALITLENASIALGSGDNNVVASFEDTDTSEDNLTPDTKVIYDLYLYRTADSKSFPLLRGTISVLDRATQKPTT